VLNDDDDDDATTRRRRRRTLSVLLGRLYQNESNRSPTLSLSR